MGRLDRQVLLCDADDTLWENNGYFLDALVQFLDLVEKRGAQRKAAEQKLREVEAVRTKSAGYGSLNYAISLCDTYELLLGPMPAAERQVVEDLGRRIYEHAIELLPGVHETVADLSGRHQLWIVTKGHYEEQLSKIQRCGIAQAFAGFEILPEKNAESFEELVERHGFDRRHTWMIGNSPRSDMNTASAVGLRTVHIPHRTIWEFEHEVLKRPPDLTLKAFPELLTHF
jgi:putative hydrolase of the HAD superfamily